MDTHRYIVIMAGGRGERFWPKSRIHTPKHLLPIVGDSALLAQTLERVKDVVLNKNILIITNQQQEESIRILCDFFGPDQIIAEPEGRDTAAAVGLAMVLIKLKDPKAVFAVLPADHVIYDVEAFHKVLNVAFFLAEKESSLITIGIKPTHAHTGYGYIQRREEKVMVDGVSTYPVRAFKEKPILEVAQKYLKSSEYFWNAGMFIWHVNTIEKAFKEKAPKLFAVLEELEGRLLKKEPLRIVLDGIYGKFEKISVDYAIMEKSDNVKVLESLFDWDDVGEWPAIVRHFDSDAKGNVVRGEGVVHEGYGNLIVNDNDHLTALVGVNNLMVINTKDATLVCPKEKSQEIKSLLKRISSEPKYLNWL